MYNFIRILLALFYKIFYKVTIVNKEKIEKTIIIRCNHFKRELVIK